MGVDPVSMFVAALVVAALVKRVPGVIANLAEAAARREVPEDTDATDRLRAAGVDPAEGDAARRYFGNLWRDVWRDLDEKRQARRDRRGADRPAPPTPTSDTGRSWLDKLADKVDAKVTDTVGKWKKGDGGPPPPAAPTGWDPPVADGKPAGHRPGRDGPTPKVAADPSAEPSAGPGARTPRPGSDSTGGVRPQAPATGPTRPTDPPPSHHRPTNPPIGLGPEDETVGQRARAYRESGRNVHGDARPAPTARGPVTGTLERNDQPSPEPGRTQQVIEGEVMSAVVPARGGTVTGGTSGAAEAKAIQRAVEDANNAYVAAMEAIKHRIVRLGEQTLSQVQMAQRSHVVQLTVQAAEAAAAAQAAAKRCGNEVGPILGQVARAFQRLLT